jgi:hypothetical protein
MPVHDIGGVVDVEGDGGGRAGIAGTIAHLIHDYSRDLLAGIA